MGLSMYVSLNVIIKPCIQCTYVPLHYTYYIRGIPVGTYILVYTNYDHNYAMTLVRISKQDQVILLRHAGT